MDALSALSSSSTTSAESGSLSGLASDFDSFLQLWLTQLQNQDPSEPLDTNEMTDQIVQFTQAEQQINTNNKLDQLIDSMNATTAASAGTYIGREIEYSQPEFVYEGNPVEFDYVMSTKADKVTVTVTDAAGAVINSFTGDTSAGKTSLTWDGKDQQNELVEDGIYKIKVEALDNNGDKIPVEVINHGVISRANYKDGELQLGVGDIDLAVEDIVSINGDAVLSALNSNSDLLGLLNDNTINGLSALNGAINQNSILASTLSLINKNIEYSVENITVGNGSATDLQYKLAENYDNVKLIVKDSNGTTIYNESVDGTSGYHQFDIADIQTQTGSLADGDYTVEIEGTNDGTTSDISAFLSGNISEIDMVGSTPSLFVNNTKIGLNQITRIVN